MKVNKKKFLAARQLPFHSNPLSKRAELFLIPALEPFLTNEREKVRVSLMAGRKGKNTLIGWNRSIRRFLAFLDERRESLYEITENVILDYIFSLEDNKVSYNIVSGQRSALTFMMAALRLPRVWSGDVNVCYLSVLHRASTEKRRPKKAVPLQIEALRRAAEVHVMPFLNEVDKVRIFKFNILGTLKISYKCNFCD